MKWLLSLTLASQSVFVVGCDAPVDEIGDAETSVSSFAEEVAVVDHNGLTVRFFAFEETESETPTIGISVVGEAGMRDVVEPLMNGGATALEVFSAVSPDSQPPAELIEDHERVTMASGRDPEIRSYSEFRGFESVETEAACTSETDFLWFLQEVLLPGYSYNKVDVGTGGFHTTSYTASSNSSRDIRARVCAEGSSFGCYQARFRVVPFTRSASGSVATGPGQYVMRCQMYRFYWSSQVQGSTYGVQAHHAQIPQGYDWVTCPDCVLNGFMAVGQRD